MLNELQCAERERDQAVVELKDGVEATTRERRTTPRQIFGAAVARRNTQRNPKSPDIECDFLPRFQEYAGGDAWINRGKPAAAKPKKDAHRAKKTSSF